MFHLLQRGRVNNGNARMFFNAVTVSNPLPKPWNLALIIIHLLTACCGHGRILSVGSALCKPVLGQQGKLGGCQTENSSSFLVRGLLSYLICYKYSTCPSSANCLCFWIKS